MPLKLSSQYLSLIAGFLFLSLYFWLGYDGITFSDDVYYLLTGKKFWEGIPISDDYHFSSRFGAYVFSGIFSHLFGLNDHLAALASLFSYLLSFFLLWRLSNQNAYRWWLSLFFITQIYFLHFLPKVYPDSILVFFVILVPITAIYRNKYPFLMALAMGLAFIIGFSTKETMVLLLPFPIILFFHDLVQKRPLVFYLWFGFWSMILLALYFGFFQWKFGNAFYHFEMVNEGHYISEYTYHDKGIGAMLKRLTYLPFLAFVERVFWPWLVLAIPGIWMGYKTRKPILFEFALTVGCLILGFWFMTSTLDFYNPIYLNPRHLIILIGPLSVLIAMCASDWTGKKIWINWMSILFILGAGIALLLPDFKMSGYLLVFGLALFFLKTAKPKMIAIAILLFLPIFASVRHQVQVKNYDYFIKAFNETILNNENQHFILTNNFVYFSRDVLFPEEKTALNKLIALENIELVKSENPEEFELFIYKYYLHAYPLESKDLKIVENWARTQNYLILEETEDKWVLRRRYKKN